MSQQYEITPEDAKKAKVPHDILLINLIFNHILVFVACLTTSVLLEYIFIVPIASIIALIYIFIGAKRAQLKANWYVSGHWQLAAKRSLIFLVMIVSLGLFSAVLYWLADGDLKPQHWALGGAAALPVMATVLALIIMESEALNHAKIGILPDWLSQKFPQNAFTPIESTFNPEKPQLIDTK